MRHLARKHWVPSKRNPCRRNLSHARRILSLSRTRYADAPKATIVKKKISGYSQICTWAVRMRALSRKRHVGNQNEPLADEMRCDAHTRPQSNNRHLNAQNTNHCRNYMETEHRVCKRTGLFNRSAHSAGPCMLGCCGLLLGQVEWKMRCGWTWSKELFLVITNMMLHG